MNCPYCGQENPETNETCDFCGGTLHEPVDTQERESQQSELAPADLPPTPDQSPAPASGTRSTGPIIQLPDTSVTPIPVPSSESLLLFDDFSNPNSGWDKVEETDYSTNYYNDAYRITVNTDMYDSWANPNAQTYVDAIVEVDATKNGGPDNNDFGLICRYQDSEHFYYAVISSDGYFGIIKVNGDSSGLLGREYLEYSDSIPQGYATNHLRLECLGDTLTFYVNGQLLDQQSDGDYAEGDVGLIAGTYDNPGTDILFDNFSVYAP
jgi:hypothetical protein